MRFGTWIAVVAAAGGAVLSIALVMCAQPAAAPAARSELAPDPAAVLYRFSTSLAVDADLSGMITQLEGRVNSPIGSPLDMTDLAELYHRRALQNGDLADYERSDALARTSLERMPTRNGAALVLAKIANAQHRFREAIAIAKDEIARKPTASAHAILATAYLALGELDQAANACDAAIKIAPNSSGYLMRALVEQAQGRDPEAAKDFSRASAVEEAGDTQGGARLRTLWGRFLLRHGDLVSAAQLFDEALRIVPEYPLARAQRAELALRTGNHKEARAMFEQAFAASRQVRYLIDLARAQELAGDRAAADATRAQVERMVRAELEDHGFGHQLDLVEILVDRGTPSDLEEAIRLGREEIERRPSADTRFQLARALIRAGRAGRAGTRDEALVQVRAALASGARDARLFELAARLETGTRAADYAREADKLDPGASGWRKLGM
jgi:tetratricopeptide (TPR) repeat protein